MPQLRFILFAAVFFAVVGVAAHTRAEDMVSRIIHKKAFPVMEGGATECIVTVEMVETGEVIWRTEVVNVSDEPIRLPRIDKIAWSEENTEPKRHTLHARYPNLGSRQHTVGQWGWEHVPPPVQHLPAGQRVTEVCIPLGAQLFAGEYSYRVTIVSGTDRKRTVKGEFTINPPTNIPTPRELRRERYLQTRSLVGQRGLVFPLQDLRLETSVDLSETGERSLSLTWFALMRDTERVPAQPSSIQIRPVGTFVWRPIFQSPNPPDSFMISPRLGHTFRTPLPADLAPGEYEVHLRYDDNPRINIYDLRLPIFVPEGSSASQP